MENEAGAMDLASQSAPQPQAAEDSVEVRLAKLEQLTEHYKGEAAKWETEAKSAFSKRDELKKKVKELDSRSRAETSDEYAARIEQLQSQINERDARLQEIELNKVNEGKLKAVRKEARKLGLKENYLDRIEKFLSLETVNPEKEITALIVVEDMKKNYPDFFGVSGERVENATSTPKLTSNASGRIEDMYRAELAKGIQADFGKMLEYQKLLTEK